MEEQPSHEKTILENIGFGVSAIGLISQLIALLFQAQTLFASPFLTLLFLAFFLFISGAVCIVVLRRKKISKYGIVPYYSSQQRLFATITLGINILVSGAIVVTIYARPCLTYGKAFHDGKVGILIADFTEGVSHLPTPKGKELADRTYTTLQRRLEISPIAEKVELRRLCAIRDEQEAKKAGEKLNAKLIIWGNSAEYAEGSFQPYFIATESTKYSSNIATPNLEYHANDSELPLTISANAVPLASFILGVIYLDHPRNPSDYNLAVEQFTFAIQQLTDQAFGQELKPDEKSVFNRTLATYYVSRGRAYAALAIGNNALSDFEKAQNIDPNYSPIYVAEGNFYYVQREFQLAKEAYQEAIIKRETATAYYGLGSAEFYLNHPQESIIAFLNAIRILEQNKEDSSDIRIILATVYREIGQDDKAREQLTLITQSDMSTQAQKDLAQEMLNSYIAVSKTPTIISSRTAFPKSTNIAFTISPSQTSISTSQFLTFFPTKTQIPKNPPPIKTFFPTLTPAPSTIFPTKTLFPTLTPAPATPTPPILTPNGPKACNDGIDNDGDGLIDLNDPQCKNKGDDNESQ